MDYKIKEIANIFLDAGGVILDETIHEKIRAEILVKIISKYDSNYSIEKYYEDVSTAVDIYVCCSQNPGQRLR